MPTRPFDALLFDLGSTLIFFDAEWPDAIQQSVAELLRQLQETGLELDENTFPQQYLSRMEAYYQQRDTEFIEYTTAYILRSLLTELGYPQVSEEVIRRVLAQMYAVTQVYWLPDPTAIPTLQELQEQGYRLGLISNAGDDADVQVLIDKAQLRPYFEVILTSAAEGIRKPNPAIFHRALERLGVEPARAAMVGDTLGADILGAQNAGIFSIWVTHYADTHANRAHQDTIRPDAIISTIKELPGLLKELESGR